VPNGHVNYGVLPVESDFALVKAWVLRTLEKEVITAATIIDEKGEGRVEVYVDGVIDALVEMKENLPERAFPDDKAEETANTPGKADAPKADW